MSETPQPNLQNQLVPEAVLKKKHDLDEMKANRAAQVLKNSRRKGVINPKKETIKVIKPEKFLSWAKSRKHNKHRYERVMKKGMQKRASDTKVAKTKVVEGKTGDEKDDQVVSFAANSVEAKFVFIIRIRKDPSTPKMVKKALTNLRLRNVDEGVFVRYTPSTRKILHLIEPFVIYGLLSKVTVNNLISRRGHAKLDGKRVPLSDNIIIEKALGDDTGMICVEDLVHEICSGGDDFGKVSSFLWPFLLTAPRSKFQKKILDMKDGKEYGDIGEEMEDYIKAAL